MDGVVTEMVKSCPGVVYDQVLLREKLEENGIPVYEVDIEYGTALTGQLRTRVEAFLETIGLLP